MQPLFNILFYLVGFGISYIILSFINRYTYEDKKVIFFLSMFSWINIFLILIVILIQFINYKLKK